MGGGVTREEGRAALGQATCLGWSFLPRRDPLGFKKNVELSLDCGVTDQRTEESFQLPGLQRTVPLQQDNLR